jgi:hypothetical protein
VRPAIAAVALLFRDIIAPCAGGSKTALCAA